MKVLKQIIDRTGTFLILAFTGYLMLLALFSTCVMGPSSNEEHTFFISDTPWPALLLVLLLVLVLGLFRSRAGSFSEFCSRHRKGIELFFLAAFLLLGIALVCTSRLRPIEDQSILLSTVRAAREGDFSEFTEPGSYYRQFPFQIGIFSFYYALSFFYGAGNYVAPQLLNVVFMALSGILLSWVVFRITGSGTLKCGTLLLYLFYCPAYFYCTYVYGTDVSLMLSLAAMVFAMKEPERMTWKTALCGAGCIALAVLLKSNSLIFLVGIEILLLFQLAFSRGSRKILLLFILLAAMMTAGLRIGNRAFVERFSGAPLAEGFPNSFWLVSGFSEGKRAPGWKTHTGLSEKLNENTEEIDALAREMVKERLDTFRAYPGYALSFFSKKIASQWNNPSFECFNMQEGRKSRLTPGPFVRNLFNGPLSYRSLPVLNLLHSCLLIGAFLYLLTGAKRLTVRELLPGIIAFGGFLFHIVWEAKAKYVFPYFLLFIPYAVIGLSGASRILLPGKEESGEGQRLGRRRLLAALCCVVVLLLFLQFAGSSLLDTVLRLSGDEEALRAAVDTYAWKDVWGK